MQKRYAIVGTGGRGMVYMRGLCGDFRDVGELVAICDVNHKRMEYWNSVITSLRGTPAPMYNAADFEEMIRKERVDTVIVTSVDRTHDVYICHAMEAGCDVISEKPLTTTPEKWRKIKETMERTKRKIAVTFNFRYTPSASKLKEVIQSGVIGKVVSVHFEWLLDTCHGADYFRRWHRDKRNSGGLQIHKCTHHFDLVNWVIDSTPEAVFAMGGLKFYGRENAELRGVTEFYSRARGNATAAKDPFALHVSAEDKNLLGLYYDAEDADGYIRDQSVFGDGISIEDNLSVMVKYHSGAVMTYSLCAHSPYEGLRLCINGDAGRVEYNVVSSQYCEAGGAEASLNEFGAARAQEGARLVKIPEIVVQKLWEKPYSVDPGAPGKGGHGGADGFLLEDIFRGKKVGGDPLGRAAGVEAGIASACIGMAINASLAKGTPILIRDLLS